MIASGYATLFAKEAGQVSPGLVGSTPTASADLIEKLYDIFQCCVINRAWIQSIALDVN